MELRSLARVAQYDSGFLGADELKLPWRRSFVESGLESGVRPFPDCGESVIMLLDRESILIRSPVPPRPIRADLSIAEKLQVMK